MNSYPQYARTYLPKTGRELVREARSSGHIRFYFPDLRGRLRLVLIGDLPQREKRYLDPRVLVQAFGVTPEDLFTLPSPDYLRE